MTNKQHFFSWAGRAIVVAGLLAETLLLAPAALAAPANAGPTISFNMMSNGETIKGNSADLMALIGGADVMAMTSGIVLNGLSIGRAPVAGQGFWEAMIDGKPAGVSVCDTLSVPNDAMPQISSGSHTVQLVLMSNDWQQLATTPTITVNFANAMSYTPAAGPTGIKITKVTAPSASNRFEVRVDVSGFKLSGADIGKAPMTGVGHWNAYVDGKYAGLSTTQMVSIPNDAPGAQNLAAGSHTIEVKLVNNDNTPVAGAKSDTASVVLAAPTASSGMTSTTAMSPAPAAAPAMAPSTSPAMAPTLPKTGEPVSGKDLGVIVLVGMALIGTGAAARKRGR